MAGGTQRGINMCRVILGLVCISPPFFLYMVMYVVIDIQTEYQSSCHGASFGWQRVRVPFVLNHGVGT